MMNLLIFLLLGSATAGSIYYQYNHQSCEDLIPKKIIVYEPEPEGEPEQLEGTTIEPEAETTADEEKSPPVFGEGDPPVYIEAVPHGHYRRHRVITVKLQSELNITAFMLQAREDETENVTRVGRFEKIPRQAAIKDCGESESRVVGDNGQTMSLAESQKISLMWRAPNHPVGNIYFAAGVLIEGTYWIIKSSTLEFKPFPVDTSECGETMMCFRSCGHRPFCQSWDSIYTLQAASTDDNQLAVTLGANLEDEKDYVAVGFTNDTESLTNSDIVVCMKNDENDGVQIAHYKLSGYGKNMDIITGKIHMIEYDVENGYIWCSYRRPLRGPGSHALNTKHKFYHFYFTGKQNNESEPVLPSRSDIMWSPKALHFTEKMNYIQSSAACAFSSVYVCALVLIFSLSKTSKMFI